MANAVELQIEWFDQPSIDAVLHLHVNILYSDNTQETIDFSHTTSSWSGWSYSAPVSTDGIYHTQTIIGNEASKDIAEYRFGFSYVSSTGSLRLRDAVSSAKIRSIGVKQEELDLISQFGDVLPDTGTIKYWSDWFTYLPVIIENKSIVPDLHFSTYNDDMLIDKSLTVRRGMPLIYGSQSSIQIPRQNIDVMKIPSYGFMTGAAEALGLEFWIIVEDVLQDVYDTDILTSAKPIITFSKDSYLGLFKNQLVLTYGTEYVVGTFEKYNYPVLVNINYLRRANKIYVSMLIDGSEVVSHAFDYIEKDSTTKDILFSNPTSYRIVYGPIVMYPYNINKEMAKKHFVFGQGTKISAAFNNLTGGKVVESGAKFSQSNTALISIPDLTKWDAGIVHNMQVVNNALEYINYKSPEYVTIDNDDSYYTFSNVTSYFTTYPFGIAIEYNRTTSSSPTDKKVIGAYTLNHSGIVVYEQDAYVKVDLFIWNIDQNQSILVEDVINIPLPPVLIGANKINFGIIFSEADELFAPLINSIMLDSRSQLTIGHVDKQISDIVELNPDNDRYRPMEVNSIPYLIKFLHESIDDPSIGLYGLFVDYGHAALNWKNEGKSGRFYQRGYWEKEFPISVLTSYVEKIEDDGNPFKVEDIDTIQFNTDNLIDTEVFVCIYQSDVLPHQQRTTQLNFTSMDQLLGYYVRVQDNDIINLPDIQPDIYKNLIIRIVLYIDVNKTQLVSEQVTINELKLKGMAIENIRPLTFGNINGGNVAPFERTSNMIFPKWNTELNLVSPSLDMPYYYLNKRSAYYLPYDTQHNYETSPWDQGFLIQKDLASDNTDKIYGFSTFFYVEPFPTNKQYKFMRLNPTDGRSINKYGDLRIKSIGNNQFQFVHNPITNYPYEVFVGGFLRNPSEKFNCDRWYHLSVIYPDMISMTDDASHSMYLEFLSPYVFYSNFSIFTVNQNIEAFELYDYFIKNKIMPSYLYSLIIGNDVQSTSSLDTVDEVPIMQTAWISAYMNILWENVSLQIQNNV